MEIEPPTSCMEGRNTYHYTTNPYFLLSTTTFTSNHSLPHSSPLSLNTSTSYFPPSPLLLLFRPTVSPSFPPLSFTFLTSSSPHMPPLFSLLFISSRTPSFSPPPLLFPLPLPLPLNFVFLHLPVTAFYSSFKL